METTFPTSTLSNRSAQGVSRPNPEDLYKALVVQVSEEPLVERKLTLQLQLVAALGAAHSFKCTESLEVRINQRSQLLSAIVQWCCSLSFDFEMSCFPHVLVG